MSKRCCAQMCFNSVLTNNTVTYFRFPKEMGYATAWAVAADRSDLLGKSLNNLVKYYLCSEHFTEDCFQDPPANTKLKKTSRPVTAPIPSIFNCNISRFVSRKNQLNDDKVSEDYSESIIHESSPMIIQSPEDESEFGLKLDDSLDCERITDFIEAKSPGLESNHLSESFYLPENDTDSPVESYDVLKSSDHIYNECNECYEDCFDVVDEKLEDGNSIEGYQDNYELNEEHREDGIIEDETAQTEEQTSERQQDDEEQINVNQICRLCAGFLQDEDSSVKLFTTDSDELTDNIQRLLPNLINRNDFFPQQICFSCAEQVELCINTINSFTKTQEIFKQMN